MKKHFLYMMRYALCGIVLMSAWCAIAAEGASDDTQQIAALQDEVEKDVKENKGSMSFDKLFAIWDKTTSAVSKGVSKGAAKGASLLDMLPKSLLNSLIQKELGLKNVSITKGPAGYKNSFNITGTAMAAGKPVFVSLLYAPIVPGQKRVAIVYHLAFHRERRLISLFLALM